VAVTAVGGTPPHPLVSMQAAFGMGLLPIGTWGARHRPTAARMMVPEQMVCVRVVLVQGLMSSWIKESRKRIVKVLMLPVQESFRPCRGSGSLRGGCVAWRWQPWD